MRCLTAMLAMLVSLAACSDDTFVAIQVSTTDPSIVTVELFVADQPCDSCEGIAPPMATFKPSGPVEYTGTGVRFVATIGGDGIAGFRIQPGADSPAVATVAKLAAVGFTADGTPKGFVLDESGFSIDALRGTVRRYELAARPIATEQPSTMPHAAPNNPKNGDDDPSDSIVVWRSPIATSTTPSCLAIEHEDGTNEFFVPPDDPDCDGITTDECDPDWYQHTEAVSTSPCFTNVGPACVVGRTNECIDGRPPLCTPVAAGNFCVPDEACSVCTNLELDSSTCLDALTHPNASAQVDTTVTSLHCTVKYAPGMICMEGPATVVAGTTMCTASFATLGQTFPNTTPSTTISFTTPTFAGTLLVDVMPPCKLSITPTFHLVGAPIPRTEVAEGVLVLTPSLMGARTLLLPVIVDFAPTASTATCTLGDFPLCELTRQPDDRVYTCAQ